LGRDCLAQFRLPVIVLGLLVAFLFWRHGEWRVYGSIYEGCMEGEVAQERAPVAGFGS
jgi:hypothetical protein